MNTPKGGDASTSVQPKKLPAKPSLEHLQKQAKQRVRQTPSLKLAKAQHQLAQEYGCKNWADLASRCSIDPTESLKAAVLRKDAKAIARLLDAGANINRRFEDGSTPLHLAAKHGPAEIVDLLFSRGARNWIADNHGQLPLDYAKASDASSGKEAIIALFSGPRIKDPVFREAVDAITAGNLQALKRLLQGHPQLVEQRAEEKGQYAGSYFYEPTLLHFIAENPTRTGKLPPNIREITQAILAAGAEVDAVTNGPTGSTTLCLVATSEPAHKQGLQLPLIELLAKNGADPRRAYFAAVIHREKAAVELLLKLAGNQHTLHTAASMGKVKLVREFLKTAPNQEELAEAATVAIAGGHQDCLELILAAGLPVDSRVPHHPYSPTLLHEAGSGGQREITEFLLTLGADAKLRDTQFNGTPADWAHVGGHAELESLLRQAENPAAKTESQGTIIDHQINDAVRLNNLETLQRLLDKYPEKLSLTGGEWNKPLLHCAAWAGHLPVVRELLQRGADVNACCEGDHACAIHFAAGDGHLDVVRFLLDAGSEIDAGDNDHQLNVLGWATSLDQYHEEVARYLLSQGATQTIWSAIALNDGESVRALVKADPSLLQARMSRNEYFRTPLHHAIERNRPEMIRLLLELGADPNARDSMGLGVISSGSADTNPEILSLLESKVGPLSLPDVLSLGRFDRAAALLASDPGCVKSGGSEARLLVYAICRQNWPVAEWLLDHGADINAVAEVYQCPATALHFAIESAPVERVRWLLERGADTTIPDGKYQADALGWTEFFGKSDLAEMIQKQREES